MQRLQDLVERSLDYFEPFKSWTQPFRNTSEFPGQRLTVAQAQTLNFVYLLLLVEFEEVPHGSSRNGQIKRVSNFFAQAAQLLLLFPETAVRDHRSHASSRID